MEKVMPEMKELQERFKKAKDQAEQQDQQNMKLKMEKVMPEMKELQERFKKAKDQAEQPKNSKGNDGFLSKARHQSIENGLPSHYYSNADHHGAVLCHSRFERNCNTFIFMV